MMDFTQILPALEQHPDIVVTRGQLLPGATEQEIEAIEARIKARLHPAIRNFYQAHNGVAVEWIYRGSSHFNNQEWSRSDEELPFFINLFEDYSPPVDGQAIFLPIQSIFTPDYDQIEVNGDWGEGPAWSEYLEAPQGIFSEPFTFADHPYASEEEFRASLRLVDFFLRDSGILLRPEEGAGDPPVFFLDGSWGNFKETASLPLSQYLEAVTADLGMRWERHRYFHQYYQVPSVTDPAIRLEAIISTYDY